ncbi:MAG: saccharopine dehydrogenase NADP-binding domain-containing protein [Candidatus Bathyarchaeota archaeon]|nr:saccharopine dehydrogenase NADP-binding domain-containing protein [Candidatus Bathyarchaeota archaeon]
MKISVIGTGVQGSAIASILAKTPDVSEIVCSDINLARTRRVVENLRSDKVSAQRVDASNVDDLLRVLKGSDAVINATLPRFNLNIMSAALKSGAYYVDLATDFPETLLPKEFALSAEWEKVGLTAVINQGGPFVMNVFARYAADQLDRVDEIRLRFGWKSPPSEELVPTWSPIWCPEIALIEWTSEPAIYENGKFKRVSTFSGIEEYPFPYPVGPLKLCFIDYEPVWTLPRFIGKGIKYVDCKIPPDTMAGALIKMGFASGESVQIKGVKVAPRDVLLALTPPPSEVDYSRRIPQSEEDMLGCYLVEVRGERADQKLVHTIYTTISAREAIKKYGTFWARVAVPAVITATMLARGEVKRKGVIPPEGLEPKPFIARLAEWGMTFQETIAREIRPA